LVAGVGGELCKEDGGVTGGGILEWKSMLPMGGGPNELDWGGIVLKAALDGDAECDGG